MRREKTSYRQTAVVESNLVVSQVGVPSKENRHVVRSRAHELHHQPQLPHPLLGVGLAALKVGRHEAQLLASELHLTQKHHTDQQVSESKLWTEELMLRRCAGTWATSRFLIIREFGKGRVWLSSSVSRDFFSSIMVKYPSCPPVSSSTHTFQTLQHKPVRSDVFTEAFMGRRTFNEGVGVRQTFVHEAHVGLDHFLQKHHVSRVPAERCVYKKPVLSDPDRPEEFGLTM